MDAAEKNTRRIIWAIGLAIVVSMVIVGGILLALLGPDAQQGTSNSSRQSDVATTSEVERDITALDEDVEQLEVDNKDAQAAVDDSKKQTKVGS